MQRLQQQNSHLLRNIGGMNGGDERSRGFTARYSVINDLSTPKKPHSSMQEPIGRVPRLIALSNSSIHTFEHPNLLLL